MANSLTLLRFILPCLHPSSRIERWIILFPTSFFEVTYTIKKESGRTMENISTDVSRTIQTKLVLPPDTNHLGTIFGGKVLSYIDEIAAIAAMKHSKNVVVTASIDTVNFLSSARVGDILILEGVVVSTGRTSMEVYVKVECEHIETRERRITTTSFLTMVAIDQDGKPVPVPGIIPETQKEHELLQHASERRQQRIKKQHHTSL